MLGNDVKVQTVIHIGTVAFFALMCMFVCVRYECMSYCFCTFFLEFVSCVGFRFLCLCASMIVLGDLVAGVTNCEVIIVSLLMVYDTERFFDPAAALYHSLTNTRHQIQRISCLPFSLTWMHKTLGLFILLFCNFLVDL